MGCCSFSRVLFFKLEPLLFSLCDAVMGLSQIHAPSKKLNLFCFPDLFTTGKRNLSVIPEASQESANTSVYPLVVIA